MSVMCSCMTAVLGTDCRNVTMLMLVCCTHANGLAVIDANNDM